jgi:predicted TIM-barrel fold metal-dependent hydrolase
MPAPVRSAAAILVLAACGAVATAQDRPGDLRSDPAWVRSRYGGWGGPGVQPEAGPMDGVAVKDYAPQPSLVLPETTIERARFPVIDVHAHVLADTPDEVADWVRTMDAVGVETTVILTRAVGADFDRLAELYLRSHPGRFILFCGLDVRDIDAADYPRRAVDELVRCHAIGARGVGELTDKGVGLTRDSGLAPEQRLHPDDPRLATFWDKCGELRMPVNIHVADHPSAWKPLDVYQERTPDFQGFNLHGKNVASWDDLITRRDRMLARHRGTVFIACHLGNQGHDLAALDAALEAHPNLYVDISARDYEIGRTPRSSARFLARRRDRVLFGTDMTREAGMYRAWWRLLESADEYMPGRVLWRYYGLDLPDPVLESLYRGTAVRILGLASDGRPAATRRLEQAPDTP